MPSRAPRRTPLLALALGLATGAALCAPAPAYAVDTGAAACDAPVPSTTQPGYSVADPDCDRNGVPFTALPGAVLYSGIDDGQAWRIEVPDDWNGDLVVWAHGFRGFDATVHVDSPTLRPHFLSRGYAWAASSFQTNGYDPEQGVRDSRAMVDRFRAVVPEGGALDEVLVYGASMGGAVAVEAVERHPEAFDAAYPVCGALWDVEQFDWLLDASVLAAAATDTEITVPVEPTTWAGTVRQQILPELFTQRPALAPSGEVWGAALQQRSGGERPGFASSLAYWNSIGLPPFQDLPYLLAFFPGLTGTPAGVVADNAQRVYQLDRDPALSPAEAALNEATLRVTRPGPVPTVPDITATAEAPVLSLHTLGDLFVPLAAEQVYAAEAAESGTPFVSRAIRANGHCEFTPGELAKGFDDLVRWTRTGIAPAGDPVLDPQAVAAPTFGCRFTETSRPTFVAQPCLTFPDIEDSVHARAIRAQLAAGVVRGLGDGTFAPAATITRGQFASLAARALGVDDEGGEATFSDVAGSVHADAIRALADLGIVRGHADGTFRPGDLVTRGQVASVLARALQLDGSGATCFPDVAASAHGASICALADLAIINGLADGTFGPGQPVTRGQAASLVDRAFG